MKKLFKLIKSLSKEEKKKVTQYVHNQKKEATIYATLFNEIIKQEAMNETIIREQLEQQYKLKYWSVSKNYLYDLILKILRSTDKKNDSEKKILDGLQDIKILFQKGLYAGALKRLQTIKKIAIKYDHFHLLQILYEKEINLNTRFKKITPLEVEAWKINSLENLNRIQCYTKHRILVIEEYSQLSISPDKEEENYLETTKLEQFIEDNPDLELKIKELIIERMTLYYMQIFDLPSIIDVTLKCIYEYEKHPHFIVEYEEDYLGMLTLLIETASSLAKWDLVEQLLERYKGLNDKKVSINSALVEYDICLMKWVRMDVCRPNIEGIKNIEAILTRKKTVPKFELILPLLRLTTAYFSIKEFDRALGVLNHLGSIFAANKNVHLNLGLLLSILIFIEKEEWLLLPYKVESLYKRINNFNSNINQFERVMVSFLRKIATNTALRDQKVAYAAHKEKLTALLFSEKRGRQYFLIYWAYFCWLESKITTSSLQEVFVIEGKILEKRLMSYHH